MTAEEKSHLLNLLRSGELKAALEKLLALDLSESSQEEAIAISARYHQLKKQSRFGILSFEQSNISENQITAHLIDLISNHDLRPFPKEKSIDVTNPPSPIYWKYITLAILIIAGLGSLLEALNVINVFPDKNLQLTVFVTDTDGNVVLEHKGELNTSIGNRPMRETIGANGRSNFGDILPEYQGDSITIGFNAEGWEIADAKNSFVFTGEPIYLKVKKDDSLGTIKGMIKTRDGQNFIEGAQVLINTDTTILTNANGIFKIVLPENMRVTKATDGYKLTISKAGYNTKTEYYYSKSSDAEIRLEKSN